MITSGSCVRSVRSGSTPGRDGHTARSAVQPERILKVQKMNMEIRIQFDTKRTLDEYGTFLESLNRSGFDVGADERVWYDYTGEVAVSDLSEEELPIFLSAALCHSGARLVFIGGYRSRLEGMDLYWISERGAGDYVTLAAEIIKRLKAYGG